MMSSHPAQDPQTPADTAAYRPPRVEDLGRWAAVTLIQSVPITGFGLPSLDLAEPQDL
ncbi:hypothetical protein [Deinococcus radiotolerans]|nr:hypothetical protein [Deinococcus radiotolerans]